MTTPARYQFLPWVRQGAANAFKNPDNVTKPNLARADGKPLDLFPVRLSVNDQPPVGVDLHMIGPGEVTGIDPRVVIRADPTPNSTDFEPNYLPCIEFDPPDFPWLFTPASAGQQGRLRPWLALVAVEQLADGSVRLDATPGQPLPVLTAPLSELPDLADSWMWAHAQVVQANDSQTVLQLLSEHPTQNLSRLICPRRLEPSTHYLACLVPAFEIGVKAGLGQDITEDDQKSLRPAWSGSNGQVRIPVYYHWEFRTGYEGDFESLARKLHGEQAGENIGRRNLRVDHQPYDLPDVGVMIMEGALTSTVDVSLPQASLEFQRKLRDLLNLSAAQPVVTPPIYGRWQGALTVVPNEGQPPPWAQETNLDPTQRAAAGLGARVVQDHQDQIVAAAWAQAGDAVRVQQLERRLEVAVAVLGSVVRRRVEPMEVGQLVQFLGPAQTRMRASPETLRASLARQGLPPSYSSGTFRRALRPAGSLSRKIVSPVPGQKGKVALTLLQRIPAVEPPAGTLGLVTREIVGGIKIPPLVTSPMQRYREAVLEAMNYFNRFTGVQIAAQVPTLEFNDTFKAALTANLNPAQTAPRRFFARLEFAGQPVRPPSQPGRSIVSGPSYPQPMYEALRDLSPEFLLPGVGQIGPDSVMLLKSNARFIEAFMLGLNHELASELLWREFPSDLRQTYFQNFWDMPGSAQNTAQLPQIDTWEPSSHLGDHFDAGSEQLVLLLRSELLRRYPDALIYAVKAKTTQSLGAEEIQPVFRGRIEPDITFLGFELSEDTARGSSTDAGWFFVIQEHPGAPRFGMDEFRTQALSTWNDLAWSDLRTQPGDFLKQADLAVAPPPTPPNEFTWGFNAAHMAGILRQRPVRVALHARHLLPPKSTPPNPPVPPVVP